MTPDELIGIGDRLVEAQPGTYGSSWQRALAAELGIPIGTMRYYAAGQRHIPRGTAQLIRMIANEAAED